MKTYSFHSPKTAGSTIACLNMALLYQFQNPTQRVAILQCSRYPDLNLYLNIPVPTQTLAQVLAFSDTPEWSPALIGQLKQNNLIDSIPSPRGDEWENFDSQTWADTYELISQQYDVCFVDLGRDIPKEIQTEMLNKSDAIVTTSCLDPVSLSALKHFLETHDAHKSKQYLLINQAPKEAKSLVEKHLTNQGKRILGLLPLETKTMWDQVYKGFPIALQKKSTWKKALQQSLETLQTL